MINIEVYKTKTGQIFGFKAINHGKHIVCAAVSALTINAVNSIEKFADCKFICDHNPKGGLLSLKIPDIESGIGNEKAELLLNSLMLGLLSVKSEHNNVIKLTEVQ
ncbi:MAG: ribosomal-processing cysteine protease Prp [Defluviitaleaceae bacterium]|nr:ribosomal-processing cysteine protease Prp [Defluviitaleaceae bacterium]